MPEESGMVDNEMTGRAGPILLELLLRLLLFNGA